MAGHLGVERVTTLNLKVVQTDVERGLILVEGAVPGAKGGWITLRDAVKKSLPQDAPKPGKFRLPDDAAVNVQAAPAQDAPPATPSRPSEGARDMQLQVKSLDGSDAGSIELPDAIFGLEPRIDILHRCVRWQLAKRQRGTHDVKNRSEINRTGKKMYRQKGTGSARHGSARANYVSWRRTLLRAEPRSHAFELPKKVRALALKHAFPPRQRTGPSSCSTRRV